MAAIGVSTPRRDSEPKVRGATRFAADAPVHGLMHARLVLAHEAHALIAAIRTDAALAVPGVVAVLTSADLPLVGDGPGRLNEPLAREEVVYAGQPVALVVADTEALAEDGAELVEVELEPLEAVLDLQAAARPGAPRARVRTQAQGAGSELGDAHAAVSAGGVGEREQLSENVLDTARLEHGDVDAALAASEHVVGATFTTPWMYQGYIEPQTATARVEPNGELIVDTATQAPFATRDALARLFGLPLERVRVRGTPLGGAFGGKMMIVEPLVAAASLVVRRPVRLVMTRSEDIAATNPAGAELLTLELGADGAGQLTGIRARVLVDRGANDDFGVESIAAMLAAGPYRWRAHELSALGIATNRVTFGAYRAPTAAPAAFAVESLLDELARRLALDPLELRLANVAVEGDQAPSGQQFPVFGARQCLERVRDHALWAKREQLPDGEGIGVALGWWPGGYEPAAAVCRLDADGRLTVITGAADMTGVETGFAAIAAEAFGLDPTRVRVVNADTGSAPYAGTSGGSKVTYTVGRAVERAAIEARERLLAVAAQELEIAPEDLELVDGAVAPKGVPAKALALEELAPKILSFGSPHPPVEGHGRVSQPQAPQAAAHVSHVRVDPDTGGLTVLAHVIAQDVGRALNPALVRGQMSGGTTQGLGWALLEELAYDGFGQLTTGTLVDYALPTATITPPIETEIVEVPAPEGPYGAKGVGEAPVAGVPGAVANAVAAATGGVRVRQLPMTPERVWRALNGNT
ncbi:MAG: xanthine dehydrogenase family protein [Solirubrobacterales bacterium]|nr:xanthine dehydrogenase family protein [Solirubrobacterales bacterium]MBV9471636.1 xanthine dehydrogenase family protein [Solirubrobacterales bacterium]